MIKRDWSKYVITVNRKKKDANGNFITVQEKYLPTRARLQAFNEDFPIDNDKLGLYTVCLVDDNRRAKYRAELVNLALGRVVRSAEFTAYKDDFGSKYVEAAETMAIGRLLGMSGYGTEYLESFDDDGSIYVDAPVKVGESETEESKQENSSGSSDSGPEENSASNASRKSYHRNRVAARKQEQAQEQANNDAPQAVTPQQKSAINSLMRLYESRFNDKLDYGEVCKEVINKDDVETYTEAQEVIKYLSRKLQGEDAQ